MRLQRDRRIGAIGAAERQTRHLRGADDDHLPGPPLPRSHDRQHADRPRPLDHDRRARLEAFHAQCAGAIECAGHGAERLHEAADQHGHVGGETEDFGGRQSVEVNVDHLRPAAPQMRRPRKADLAPVVGRVAAAIRARRVVQAVVTPATRHQRWQHHRRADRQRLPHVVAGQLRPDLFDHAGQLVSERERPRQLTRPVPAQDVQVGAAHPAGIDADQRTTRRHRRPRHAPQHRRRAGTIVGNDPHRRLWRHDDILTERCRSGDAPP